MDKPTSAQVYDFTRHKELRKEIGRLHGQVASLTKERDKYKRMFEEPWMFCVNCENELDAEAIKCGDEYCTPCADELVGEVS